jgi:hypothetical protein
MARVDVVPWSMAMRLVGMERSYAPHPCSHPGAAVIQLTRRQAEMV